MGFYLAQVYRANQATWIPLGEMHLSSYENGVFFYLVTFLISHP